MAGTLLLVLNKNEALAGVMIAAGAGVLTRQVQVAKKNARESRQREQDALETTQTLRAELLQREKRKET